MNLDSNSLKAIKAYWYPPTHIAYTNHTNKIEWRGYHWPHCMYQNLDQQKERLEQAAGQSPVPSTPHSMEAVVCSRKVEPYLKNWDLLVDNKCHSSCSTERRTEHVHHARVSFEYHCGISTHHQTTPISYGSFDQRESNCSLLQQPSNHLYN